MANTDERKVRLGRGLAALIGEQNKVEESGNSSTNSLKIDLSDIRTNPFNPRSSFDQEKLAELEHSIREKGIIQPIVVRPTDDDSSIPYEIVAGERRWRAAQLAGLTDIPAIVVELNSKQALEVAIIENIQRDDLSSIEEARSYQALLDRHDYLQEDIARIVGKSRSHITNLLRLLSLPPRIQNLVDQSELTMGQVRPLIGHDNAEELADRILLHGLSARGAEELVRRDNEPRKAKAKVNNEAESDSEQLGKSLSRHLGMTVKVNHKQNGRGQLVISYHDLSQLEFIRAKLEQ